MKKIAKLTWLHNGNYGSILQAVALQEFLIEQGFDVIDLNYNASLTEKLINWTKSKNSPKLFMGKIQEFKTNIFSKDLDKFHKRTEKFIKFKKKWMNCSDLLTSPKDLKQESKKYDIFICGSDQIWSPALLNPVFYLDFVPEEKKKIAYAPSFGVINTTSEKDKLIAKYIKRFDSISVREIQGKEYINKLIGIDVPLVLDPTFLISEHKWREHMESTNYKKPYVFCYLLSKNEKYINMVKDFAKNKRYDVIIVPTKKGPFESGFYELIDVGPGEWLDLLYNAKYIFTDSYHGSIFSLLFHKNFTLFKRFNDDDKTSENSRIYSLFSLLNIENRIIDETNLNEIEYITSIDYDKIDRIISKYSNISKKWIVDALEKAGAKND